MTCFFIVYLSVNTTLFCDSRREIDMVRRSNIPCFELNCIKTSAVQWILNYVSPFHAPMETFNEIALENIHSRFIDICSLFFISRQ